MGVGYNRSTSGRGDQHLLGVRGRQVGHVRRRQPPEPVAARHEPQRAALVGVGVERQDNVADPEPALAHPRFPTLHSGAHASGESVAWPRVRVGRCECPRTRRRRRLQRSQRGVAGGRRPGRGAEEQHVR
eukprot:SAG11_NODE_348_length_10402_cov_8.763467_9_plen_130_part_00